MLRLEELPVSCPLTTLCAPVVRRREVEGLLKTKSGQVEKVGGRRFHACNGAVKEAAVGWDGVWKSIGRNNSCGEVV